MKVHLVGVGGIGMSGLARLLLSRGNKVSGSDLSSNALVERMRLEGATIFKGHQASFLDHPDCVVYSSSITPRNPELLSARNRGLSVMHRGQMLARLVNRKRTIAVTGTHGKSTTSAMSAQLLSTAGLDPTTLLGAEVEKLGGNAKPGQGAYAVVEADESDGSLLWLSPEIAIVTNIDEEHLDYFRNFGEIMETYALFTQRIAAGGTVVGCADDRWVMRLLSVSNRETLTYGLSRGARIRAAHIEEGTGASRFEVMEGKRLLGKVQLAIPGIHNVVNSLAVVALSRLLEIPFQTVQKALGGFEGAARRFDCQGEADGILVVEDYGHHPAEIKATLAAARSWKGRRILCVFQPHRFSRTKYLLPRFGSAFDRADEVILLPIYAASEEPLAGITSQRLLEAIQTFGKVPAALCEPEGLFGQLMARSQSGDLVLFMGAGSIGGMAKRFVELLKKNAATAA